MILGQTQSTHRPQVQNDKCNTNLKLVVEAVDLQTKVGQKLQRKWFKFVNCQMYFGWEFFWAISPITSAEYITEAEHSRQSAFVFVCTRGFCWLWMVESSLEFHGSIQRKFTFNQHNYNGFFTPITVNCKQSSFLLDRTLWAGPFIQNTYLHNQYNYK